MNAKGLLTALLMVAVLACISGLIVWAFIEKRQGVERAEERGDEAKSESQASAGDGEGVVALDAVAQARCGIATETLKPATHQQEIKAYGTVQALDGLLDL